MVTSSRMRTYVISGTNHCKIKQESIPVGCVLTAAFAAGGGSGEPYPLGTLSPGYLTPEIPTPWIPNPLKGQRTRDL